MGGKTHQSGSVTLIICLLTSGLIGLMYISIESARLFIEKQKMDFFADASVLYLSTIRKENAYKHGQQIVKSFSKISNDGSNSRRSIPAYLINIDNKDNISLSYQSELPSLLPTYTNEFKNNLGITSTSKAKSAFRDDLDIVFVIDYSGSMNFMWKSYQKEKKRRIEYLKSSMYKVINKLELLESLYGNRIRVGIVPFDEYVRHPIKRDGTEPCNIAAYHSEHSSFSAKTTMENLWTYDNSTCIKKVFPKNPYLKTVELTTSRATILDAIDKNIAYGGTASVHGIIYGARMLNRSGNTPNKIMIIIGDGQDSGFFKGMDHKRQFRTLINNHGICKEINKKLNTRYSRFNIAAIALDYDPAANHNLIECVGKANLHNALVGDKVYDEIIQIIESSPAALRG